MLRFRQLIQLILIKKLVIPVILVIITQYQALAWTEKMEREFKGRTQAYLNNFQIENYGSTAYEYEKNSYPRAMIDFLRGNREKAIAFLQADDQFFSQNQHTLGFDFYSGFTLKGQIRKYFYFGKYLNPAYRQQMWSAMKLLTEVDPLTRHFPAPRKFWQQSTDNCTTWVDCRNTDNLRAMRDTSVYLMAEETGNEATRQLYQQKIKARIRSLYQIGQGEWDSETYLGHSITSYINLYDFAQNPEVKSLAKSALDWFFTAGALKYWRGGFAGPSKRDYSRGNCVWCSGTSRALGLYFGDSPLEYKNRDPDLVHLITSSYRPPAAVVALAQKQFSKPLEMLNSKPTYENWKPEADNKPQFYETLYFGHTFQLGTLARGSGGDWNGFKLMALNQRRGVDYFIAATGTNPTKISTSSVGGDRIAQYQNLAIWLNNKANTPFMFFLPKSAQIKILRGKLLIRLEQTWLALTPINLQFNGIDRQATEKVKNRYPNDQILTAIGTGKSLTGFALEVGEVESHHCWEKFKRSVLLNSQLKVGEDIAEYISPENRLKMQYQAEGLPLVWKDGKLHKWLNHYDVYNSPIVSQKWKSGELEVSAGGYSFQAQLD